MMEETVVGVVLGFAIYGALLYGVRWLARWRR